MQPPNHVETVIATLNGDVWKLSRYFDSPQFWSSPGTVGTKGTRDVVALQNTPTPQEDGRYTLPDAVTVKSTPIPDQFEMYDVSADPMELKNLYDDGIHTVQQNLLLRLLEQQRRAERLTPQSGTVPGQASSC